jgi:alkanesulfonate monooxygenase SsuD/methylene tetrahydromethanopterin reductase-like flavin-dependent oxidoreductase (luciferase family)
MLTKRGKQTQHVRLGIGVVAATSRPTPVLEHIDALLHINKK